MVQKIKQGEKPLSLENGGLKMERFQILRTYDICGRKSVCLCDDAGPAIVYDENLAKTRVAQLHKMGYTDVKGYIWYLTLGEIDEVKISQNSLTL